MAYTQDQIDKLSDAIALGALTVEYGDKKITYRNLAEMKQILKDMQASLLTTNKPVNRKYAEYDSGL